MKRGRIGAAVLLLAVLLSVGGCGKAVQEYSAELTLAPGGQSYPHPLYDSMSYSSLTAKVSATPGHVRIDTADFGFLLDVKTQDNWLLINRRMFESTWGPGPQKFAIHYRGIPRIPGALRLMVLAASLAPPSADKPRPACAGKGCKIVGEERIDGRPTEKWEVHSPTLSDPAGSEAAYVWMDRSLGIAVKSGDFQLRHIVQKPQDPALFTPAGYHLEK